MAIAQTLLNQIKPSLKRGGTGRLFRNVGIGVTLAFLGATAMKMAADPTMGVLTATFDVASGAASALAGHYQTLGTAGYDLVAG